MLELFVVVCKHSSDQSVYEKACNIDFRLAQCFVVVCLVAGAQKVSTHNSICLVIKIYFKFFHSRFNAAPATSSPDSENSTTDPFYPDSYRDSIVRDGQQPKIYLANSKTKHFPDTHEQLESISSPEEEEELIEEHIQQTQHQQLQQQQHQQQAPLPHIEEEEETPQTSPEDEVRETTRESTSNHKDRNLIGSYELYSR